MPTTGLKWYKRLLKQTVTYWSPSTVDGFGDETYGVPVTLSGYWRDKVEHFTTSAGEERVSQSVVYLSRDVETAGFLFLGTSVVSNPKSVENAFMVQRADNIPGHRPVAETEYVYKAYL